MKPELLYLDLMKKTLSFSLWPEPLREITAPNCGRSPVVKCILSTISGMLRTQGLLLASPYSLPESLREDGKMWPVYAETMIGPRRLDNLQYCIETVLKEGIPGDLIETGVWRGGACIFMKAVLAAYLVERKVFVADSFEGLPSPDPKKYPADKGSKFHLLTNMSVSVEEVKSNFEKYGLLDDRVVFLKGWFKDTLPTAPIDKLAVLRLDGDMYESTIDSLTNLYPKLSLGGFCIVDDYALPACASAVEDYRSANSITTDIIKVDWSGIYWRKE